MNEEQANEIMEDILNFEYHREGEYIPLLQHLHSLHKLRDENIMNWINDWLIVRDWKHGVQELTQEQWQALQDMQLSVSRYLSGPQYDGYMSVNE